MTRNELHTSFESQARILTRGGIALHSFWYGDEEVAHQGLRFAYYKEDTLKALISSDYEFLEARQYSEIESDDSHYIVLRKR